MKIIQHQNHHFNHNCQISSLNQQINQKQTNRIASKGTIIINQYQYDTENILGKGFTSKVYLGRQSKNIQNQYAIKVVDKRKINRIPQNMQLLRQQIEIHQNLRHPNIVKCYQVIQKTHFIYFILQYCHGGTLQSFIKKNKKISQQAAIPIIQQILSAYKYLLNQKILHRDIKPPNILKSISGWKICDFGFSAKGKKNMIGQINVGTPFYMAPQSLQRSFYSPKTDFFSIGVLCYEMLTGSTPWHTKDEKKLVDIMFKNKITLKSFQLVLSRKVVKQHKEKELIYSNFSNLAYNKLVLTTMKCSFQKYNKKLQDHKTMIQQKLTELFKKMNYLKQVSQLIIKNNRNNAVVQRQLYYAELLWFIMNQYKQLNLKSQQQIQLYLNLLFRHAQYILRRLKNNKINYIGLKKFQKYIATSQYQQYRRKVEKLQENIKIFISANIKYRTLQCIKTMNKQFIDLTYDKHLGPKCIQNLKKYLIKIISNIEIKQQNCRLHKYINFFLTYFRYIRELSFTTDQSRTIALNKQYYDQKLFNNNHQTINISYQEIIQQIKMQMESLQQ